MVRTIFTLLVTLLMVGCGPRYIDYFPFHDDGTPKPKVALLAVIDTTQVCIPWDVSREINDRLRYQAMCNGELFLLSENEVAGRLQGSELFNYFDTDFSYVSRFGGSDYVVALELIEHDVVPYEKGMCLSNLPMQKYRWQAILQMKLRLRVIDVRCNKPKILLQEIFASDYAIPLGCEYLDYSRCGWGSSAFADTPWGRAHARMISDLVCRIETVIRGP